jgi:hypothetical protein
LDEQDAFKAYALQKAGKQAGVYTVASLQWCLGTFEARYGYVPQVYLKHPETTLDRPYPDLFLDVPALAVGVVCLGPLRVELEEVTED